MNQHEKFVLDALEEESIMWEEKTLRGVAFALHDISNADYLIDKLPSRGAYDCIKLYGFFNFLILDAVENAPDISISKLRHCSERLKTVDTTVSGLVNLSMDEIDRRIRRFLQIAKEQLDVKSPKEMFARINHIKRTEPELYSYQTYYSIYLFFLIESTSKDLSQKNIRALLHIMRHISLGMIEMSQ